MELITCRCDRSVECAKYAGPRSWRGPMTASPKDSGEASSRPGSRTATSDMSVNMLRLVLVRTTRLMAVVRLDAALGQVNLPTSAGAGTPVLRGGGGACPS